MIIESNLKALHARDLDFGNRLYKIISINF